MKADKNENGFLSWFEYMFEEILKNIQPEVLDQVVPVPNIKIEEDDYLKKMDISYRNLTFRKYLFILFNRGFKKYEKEFAIPKDANAQNLFWAGPVEKEGRSHIILSHFKSGVKMGQIDQLMKEYGSTAMVSQLNQSISIEDFQRSKSMKNATLKNEYEYET